MDAETIFLVAAGGFLATAVWLTTSAHSNEYRPHGAPRDRLDKDVKVVPASLFHPGNQGHVSANSHILDKTKVGERRWELTMADGSHVIQYDDGSKPPPLSYA